MRTNPRGSSADLSLHYSSSWFGFLKCHPEAQPKDLLQTHLELCTQKGSSAVVRGNPDSWLKGRATDVFSPTLLQEVLRLRLRMTSKKVEHSVDSREFRKLGEPAFGLRTRRFLRERDE